MKFESKHRGRIGPAIEDAKEMRILNRIVTWTDNGIEYEGDQRHVEICMQNLGLEIDSREVGTPTDKDRRGVKEEEYLDQSSSTRYRGLVARMNYLGQDRSDIQFTIKELSKDMANPTTASMSRIKRLVRYLKGAPRYIIKMKYQSKPNSLTAWSDTDFAGCTKSRKSTSGGLVMHGSHVIKSWSTNQAVIALSSGEAEYYGLVKAASVAIGVRTIANDMGIVLGGAIEICSDASAAIGIANRIGIGKVRHIEVNQLWLQQKVACKEIVITKVGTDDNLADALTKAVDAKSIEKHVHGTGGMVLTNRHRLAPKVSSHDELQYESEE